MREAGFKQADMLLAPWPALVAIDSLDDHVIYPGIISKASERSVLIDSRICIDEHAIVSER